MNAIELDSVTLDFPVKGGARYLKEQVTGRFRTEGRRTHLRALDKVDLNIQQGEILGIVGPNGAGKSTILRVMAGVYSPDEGLVRTRGKCVLLAGIGTGFQSNLTGRENIRLNGSIMGLSDEEESTMVLTFQVRLLYEPEYISKKNKYLKYNTLPAEIKS